MKIHCIFLCLCVLGLGCNSTTKVDIGNGIVNLGTYPKSEIKEASFTIKNVGNSDLLIKEVTTDCQCTLLK